MLVVGWFSFVILANLALVMGVPLPFVFYGSTLLLSLAIVMAIVLRVQVGCAPA